MDRLIGPQESSRDIGSAHGSSEEDSGSEESSSGTVDGEYDMADVVED